MQFQTIMHNKKKIALFDFCGTIVPFQSASAYIEFVATNYAGPIRKFYVSFIKLSRRLHILGLIIRLSKGRINDKLLLLKSLKGFDFELLDTAAERFYNEIIKPNIIPEVIEELKKRQQDGYRIAIVSGAFDIYLKFFAKEYKINDVVSSKLDFYNNVFTGRLSGLDCMVENKVKELDSLFSRQDLYCIAYSDSQSDIAMLRWADEGYVVTKRPSWIKLHSFKELYWDERVF